MNSNLSTLAANASRLNPTASSANIYQYLLKFEMLYRKYFCTSPANDEWPAVQLYLLPLLDGTTFAVLSNAHHCTTYSQAKDIVTKHFSKTVIAFINQTYEPVLRFFSYI